MIELQKENGVNRITVIRAEKFANCVDEAEKISPGSRQNILSGTVKRHGQRHYVACPNPS